ncbi:unnamed protein product [Pleuronectes platessa]|uniref:Uncharacterized protein n=1 Tax=Pleuronectes platessa TaxID=8262 RepID=A0A9N7Y8T7_PLEPL|nr:unnamed protein product [Pleuronectes platessa]
MEDSTTLVMGEQRGRSSFFEEAVTEARRISIPACCCYHGYRDMWARLQVPGRQHQFFPTSVSHTLTTQYTQPCTQTPAPTSGLASAGWPQNVRKGQVAVFTEHYCPHIRSHNGPIEGGPRTSLAGLWSGPVIVYGALQRLTQEPH